MHLKLRKMLTTKKKPLKYLNLFNTFNISYTYKIDKRVTDECKIRVELQFYQFKFELNAILICINDFRNILVYFTIYCLSPTNERHILNMLTHTEKISLGFGFRVKLFIIKFKMDKTVRFFSTIPITTL